jgi:hypothetical protein
VQVWHHQELCHSSPASLTKDRSHYKIGRTIYKHLFPSNVACVHYYTIGVRLSSALRRRRDRLPPSKHRLQQPGKLHSISGDCPPQSENKSSRLPAFPRKSQTEAGMDPLKKLNCTKNSFKSTSWPGKISGTVPTRPLPSKYKSLNKLGMEYSGGMVPDNVLLDMYRRRMLDTRNMVSGMEPKKILLDPSKKSSRVKLSKTFGI